MVKAKGKGQKAKGKSPAGTAARKPAAGLQPSAHRFTTRSNESGYTLLALMVALAVMMILLTAAAPNVKFQVKDEKEKELLHRGDQVAEAIERFRRTTNRYPMSMEELVNGVTVGIKQVRFLRPSAAKDPMTNNEWRLVRPGDPVIMEFAQAWSAYTQQPIPPQLAALSGIPIGDIFNNGQGNQPGRAGGARDRAQQRRAQQLQNNFDSNFGGLMNQDGTGPFIAVVSESKDASLRRRFNLESYDKWLFVYIGSGQFGPGMPPQMNQQPNRPAPTPNRPRR